MASNSRDSALGLSLILSVLFCAITMGKILGPILLIAGYFWGIPLVWRFVCQGFEGWPTRVLAVICIISAWTAFCCVI